MNLTPELVTVIVNRLFSPDVRSDVVALLDQYGVEPYEREAVRVRVALLKLSEGSLERLRERVAAAKRDYRDVLAWAEYPTELTSPTWGLAAEEAAQIRADDRAQYAAWLTAQTTPG